MANPVAVSGLAAPAAKLGGGGPAKNGPSQFDKLRQDMHQKQGSGTVELPPAVTQVSTDQKRMLASDLRKKLSQTGSDDPARLFQPELKKAQNAIQDVSTRVGALPKTPAFEGVRSRIAAIETQYQNSSKALKNVASARTPGELLNLQVQMYQLVQNVEIVSKVVDEVNSGVKQVLQTQVS